MLPACSRHCISVASLPLGSFCLIASRMMPSHLPRRGMCRRMLLTSVPLSLRTQTSHPQQAYSVRFLLDSHNTLAAISSAQSFLRSIFLHLSGPCLGENVPRYRNALGFSMSSWPKDIGFTGCHLICSDVKLELLCSRHSSPGCPRILANTDSVQKCSHVRILLCLASPCLVGTPCCPRSYIAQPVLFFSEVELPDGPLLPLEKSLANALELDCSHAAWDKQLCSSAGPQFQGTPCSRFESYIRSQCHCLAPLILSPAIPAMSLRWLPLS